LPFRVGNTGWMKLADRLPSVEATLEHPRHLAAQPLLAELITALRACANVKDGYEFQRELLTRVLEVEADRRVFGFERGNILALCQNAPPGVTAGKQGLAAEVARVDRADLEDGRFAILHDLTNCLRIGDVTVFGNDGSFETVEVKSDPGRRSPAQLRRIKAARDAIRNGGPLPGTDPMQRLHDLDIPFKTHLDLLRTGTERAARGGIFTVKGPGARALAVTDLHGCGIKGSAVAIGSGRAGPGSLRFTARGTVRR
jgi:hypothetical protein